MTDRVVVTGAAGFIGSHLCETLLQHGNSVVGADNFDGFYDRSAKERWLADFVADPRFAFVETDIRHRARMAAAVEGADAIVHLAARPGVRQSFEHPTMYADVNVGGLIALMDLARAAGIERLVVASSSSVYGEGEVPSREDAWPLTPVSPYAASKLAAELYVRMLAPKSGMRVAILRLFSVYGPRQRPDQVLMRYASRLWKGEPVVQFGDGTAERDYTHVSDVVAALQSALRWTGHKTAGCEIFNIGSGRSVRLSDLILLLGKSWKRQVAVRQEARRSGDVRRTHADIAKARSELGYEPRVSIDDGVPAFVTWYEDTYGR